MSRSLKKGPYIYYKLLNKVRKNLKFVLLLRIKWIKP